MPLVGGARTSSWLDAAARGRPPPLQQADRARPRSSRGLPVEQVGAYSTTPVMPVRAPVRCRSCSPGRRRGRTWPVPRPAGVLRDVSPGRSSRRRGCSGGRASPGRGGVGRASVGVEDLHEPLEGHVLVGVGRQVGLPDPVRAVRRRSGRRRVSVRRTRVLTKKPTRSSSASSVRPAIGVPRGMSVPAPSAVSRTARAAWTTMNTLAPVLAGQAGECRRAGRGRAVNRRSRRRRWRRGRARPVGGQVQFLGQPGQRLRQ